MSAAQRCKRYRKRILEISQRVTCHVAPAFSCIEIVDEIYNELMKPEDIFIMSKGHGSLAQYVILEERGLMDLEEFGNGSIGTHPDAGGPIAASTGSLGHGLGIAVGMAYAERLKGSTVDVFVLLGDGELQEGSTWEAVQTAYNLGLTNLKVWVDYNDFAGMDRLSKTHPAVWRMAEGCPVQWQLRRTTKGQGVSFMQNSAIWHYRSPNKAEYEQALKELDA